MEELAFVGVGAMATPMVWRFLERGWRTHLVDVQPSRTEPFRDHPHAVIHRSVDSIPDDARFVVLSLPSAAALLDVGAELSARPCRSQSIVINTSTTGMVATRSAAADLVAAGYSFVDAPVSGGPSGASQGRLTVMVSGDADSVRHCANVFEILGRAMTVGDEPGQAQAMKIANNMLSLGALAATAEATVLTRKAGIPLDVAIGVLNVSSGRNSATDDKFPNHVMTKRFDWGFPASGAVKDVSLFAELADDLGVAAPLANAILDCWRRAVRDGYGEQDCTRIVTMYEQLSALADEAGGS
jgi:3-hydroxyisobutyrate dehydrogenase-like beta-hydroxyacid dehydrogenase